MFKPIGIAASTAALAVLCAPAALAKVTTFKLTGAECSVTVTFIGERPSLMTSVKGANNVLVTIAELHTATSMEYIFDAAGSPNDTYVLTFQDVDGDKSSVRMHCA